MKIKNRTTFANVVSVAALIVATAGAGGGVAYAHGKIGSAQLKANAVKSKHVKNNNLKSKDIKNGSLGAQDLNGKTRAGLAEAGLNASPDGTVNSWFNRMGGIPTVVNTGAGNSYRVTIPGTSPSDDSVIAVLNSGESTSHCEVWDVLPSGVIQVNCRDSGGTVTHPDFQLILFQS